MIYTAIDYWNPPDSYLKHFGVKGMKWGVRHDNPNYSSEQRSRDKAVYGRGAVRRINRRMNKGESISAARSREATRINNTRRAAVTAGQIGGIIGGVGGAILGYKLSGEVLKKYGTNDPMTDMVIKSVVSMGAYRVTEMLARKGSRAATMASRGYSPSKFRY